MMRPTLRTLLTCSLLAAYASISLLGQGLHWFQPHDHHHHGSMVVSRTTHRHTHKHGAHCCDHHPHGPCCHDTDHDHDQDHDDDHVPAGPIVAARDGDTHSHMCQICEFLFQAVSGPPQVATTPDLHPLVADAPRSAAEHFSTAILGLHAARGPPQLLA
jgi:hypothetical protein